MKKKFTEILEQEAPAFAPRKKSKRKNGSVGIYTDQKLSRDENPGMASDFVETPQLSKVNIILLLVVSALVITAYISNIIQVDALMLENTKLERREAKLLQIRENLRADINSLTSYNRIQKIATEKLGLVHSRQQPYKLEVDN